jgi:hypothetical protein
MKRCACCGQDIVAARQWNAGADETVAQLVDAATDDAVRRGSMTVDVAHLVWCLVTSSRADRALRDRGYSRAALTDNASRWFSRHRRQGETSDGAAPALSAELAEVLRLAEESAHFERRTSASIEDVVAALASYSQTFTLRDNGIQLHFDGQHRAFDRTARAVSRRSYDDGRQGTDRVRYSNREIDRHTSENASRRHTTAIGTDTRSGHYDGRVPVVDVSRPRTVVEQSDVRRDDHEGLKPLLARMEQLERLMTDFVMRESRAAQSVQQSKINATESGRTSSGQSTADRTNVEPNGQAERDRSNRGSRLARGLRSRKRTNSPSVRAPSSTPSLSSSTSRLALQNQSLRAERSTDREPRAPRGAWDRGPRNSSDRVYLAYTTPQRAEPSERVSNRRSPSRETHVDDEADDGTRTKRFYLSPDDDVVKAPSIGNKTAARLNDFSIFTVRSLLAADTAHLARLFGSRNVTPERIASWQAQARLVCTVPWLRGTHAQLLVGAGYATADALENLDPQAVYDAIQIYARTRDGQSVLRTSPPPELERVAQWLSFAKEAEPARAA